MEACVEPRPAGTEIAATARTSLAYDRFADKRASGSRPRRVVRRLRYRPDAGARSAPARSWFPRARRARPACALVEPDHGPRLCSRVLAPARQTPVLAGSQLADGMTIQQSRSRHDAGYLFCLGQGRASAAASHWLPICWPMRSRAPLRPGARPWCAAVTSSLAVGSWRSCVPPRHQQHRPRAGRAYDRNRGQARARSRSAGARSWAKPSFGFGGGGEPAARITTAPVVAAAPGAVAEKQSSRECTDAGE